MEEETETENSKIRQGRRALMSCHLKTPKWKMWSCRRLGVVVTKEPNRMQSELDSTSEGGDPRIDEKDARERNFIFNIGKLK